MKELLDLHVLAKELIEDYQTLYTGDEIELPIEFKNKVNQIDNNPIVYQQYSAVVSTRGGQRGALNIYLPNQWFFIASFFTRYYNELQKYKSLSLEVLSSDRLNKLKGNSLTPDEENRLAQKYGENTKDLLKKFVTDYDWWGGGKTIDRGDFFVSPILNYAKLVNVSQSYVADLCAFLARNEKLVELLYNAINQHNTHSLSISQNASSFTLNHPLQQIFYGTPNTDKFLPYLTALRTKPFMLLAGISGTGKSRIVREMAKACWKEGDDEYGKNNPKNFCMVQVKPNWHDSTELFGYVSRISGNPEFVAGDFLKFVVKAWEEPEVPYFLCLDEMNLAPVEQYFAEYLSVIESRKSVDRIITTDPIFKKPFEDRGYNKGEFYKLNS